MASTIDWVLKDGETNRSFISVINSGGKNYYIKDTDARDKIELLSSLINAGLQLEVVAELPKAEESTMGKIYLVPASDETYPAGNAQNIKAEYVTVKDDEGYKWEKIGDTSIDLTKYADIYHSHSVEVKGNVDAAVTFAAHTTDTFVKSIGSGSAEAQDWKQTSGSALVSGTVTANVTYTDAHPTDNFIKSAGVSTTANKTSFSVAGETLTIAVEDGTAALDNTVTAPAMTGVAVGSIKANAELKGSATVEGTTAASSVGFTGGASAPAITAVGAGSIATNVTLTGTAAANAVAATTVPPSPEA